VGIINKEQYKSLEEYVEAHRARTRKKQSEAKQGEKSPTAILTESQVREIRARYIPGKRGTGSKSLAKQYGVHFRTIEQILKGETWTHIL